MREIYEMLQNIITFTVWLANKMSLLAIVANGFVILKLKMKVS